MKITKQIDGDSPTVGSKWVVKKCEISIWNADINKHRLWIFKLFFAILLFSDIRIVIGIRCKNFFILLSWCAFSSSGKTYQHRSLIMHNSCCSFRKCQSSQNYFRFVALFSQAIGIGISARILSGIYHLILVLEWIASCTDT